MGLGIAVSRSEDLDLTWNLEEAPITGIGLM